MSDFLDAQIIKLKQALELKIVRSTPPAAQLHARASPSLTPHSLHSPFLFRQDFVGQERAEILSRQILWSSAVRPILVISCLFETRTERVLYHRKTQAIAFLVGLIAQSLTLLFSIFSLGFFTCCVVRSQRLCCSLSLSCLALANPFPPAGDSPRVETLQLSPGQLVTRVERVWSSSVGIKYREAVRSGGCGSRGGAR